MKFLAVAAGCALLLSGCVTDLSSESPFREQVGRSQRIQRPCLLYHLPQGSEHQRGIYYDLYDRISSNSWRKEGWVPVGTEVRLNAVKRYLDGRGHWIGAIGTLTSPKDGKVTFLYCWSSGARLKRAPWEAEDTVSDDRKANLGWSGG